MQDHSEFLAYNPTTLSEQEKSEIEQMMEKSYKVLSKVAAEVYGFANIKKLRDEYRRNSNMLAAHPEAQTLINWMISNESRIMSGYIGVARKPCLSFSKAKENHNIASFSDLVQEAAMAIYDAMYQYNGSTKFSTYVTWCIKNRLIDSTRKNQRANGFQPCVLKLRNKVRKLMETGLNVDRAINHIQANDGRIDPDVLERLMVSLSANTSSQVELAVESLPDLSPQTEAMRRAVDSAPLSTMERNLIEAYLRGDESYRRKVSEEVINPNTGKLWTKQRLSQIFLVACDKVHAAYRIQSKAAAA